MSRIRVGIIRGGSSIEYELSMRIGTRIIDMLRKEPYVKEYEPVDIRIDQSGVWHLGGFEVTPERALRHVDVVFNALTGEYGGDGKIQHILETFHVPFTGSGAFGSIMTHDKKITKDILKREGIKTPYAKDLHLEIGQDLDPVVDSLSRAFPMPVVVKPRKGNSSLGVSIATNFAELEEALDRARQFSPEIIVEEYITGKEIVSGFIEGFRGQDHYELLPVELHAPETTPPHSLIKAKMLSFADKMSGNYAHTVPAKLTDVEKKALTSIIKKVRSSFDMRHIGTVDVIVHPKKGVYVLEVHTSPHLHEHAPLFKSLRAVGAEDEHVVTHLLKTALEKVGNVFRKQLA
jgi:D-alanine-D-alanine ligase